jgi:hypothetical protein
MHLFLYEAQGGVRQIFTDGRPLPKDPQPWSYGYSVGHWDGDTLVVDTTGFRDDVWLDIEITVDDPKAYTKPWTVSVKQKIMLDQDLIEFICDENEKDVPHLTNK